MPGDVAAAVGALRHAGKRVLALDLNQQLFMDLLGDHPAWQALSDEDTYADPARLAEAWQVHEHRLKTIGRHFGATLSFAGLELAHTDAASVRSCLKGALSGQRNPALPTLDAGAAQVLDSGAHVAAIALVHPDQRPHALAFASLLRSGGFAGRIVLFGSLEDPFSPSDFAEDLGRRHGLFLLFDDVLVGEVEQTLPALMRGERLHGVIGPRGGERAEPIALAEAPLPDWSWVSGSWRTPQPIIDLRLGRGCSWGRCTFCAIAAQQPGYRSGGIERLRASILRAHEQTGSTWFRMRDDLLTPPQLQAVGEVFASVPFNAHWTARIRAHAGWTTARLTQARASGLGELWVGLESGSERLRQSMDKGVSDQDVRNLMAAARDAEVGIRALLMVGYPGETDTDFQATYDWVREHLPQLTGVALTQYRPTRRSPIGQRPGHYGLRVIMDPVPREDRMRFELPTRSDPEIVTRRIEHMAHLVHHHVVQLPCTDPIALWVHRSLRRAAHA